MEQVQVDGDALRFDSFRMNRYVDLDSEETMARSIASLSLVVRDYDEAIAFFTDALRFTLVEDTPLGGGKRWVVVAPAGVDRGVAAAREGGNVRADQPRGRPDRRPRLPLSAHG